MKKTTYLVFVTIIVAILAGVWLYKRSEKKTIATLKKSSTSIAKEVLVPELSIEKIFSKDHDWTKKLPEKRIRILIATGDIIPARSVNYKTATTKNFNWPFEKTAETIKNADITFINLETPLIEKCPPTQEGMVFCGDERNIEGLLLAGIDVASLANNHAGNHGEEAVGQTVKLLSDNNILATGIDEPAFKNIRGVKFAFLGYNDITKPQLGVSNATPEKIKKEILEAKKKADIVVITFHWGVEYRNQPDDRQKYLGHFAIDSGADLVIGNHPHWIQPVEFYKGKLITYAHGNFVFDQMWSQKTREGVVGRYIFYDKRLVDVEYLPVQIDNYGQPHFVEEAQKKTILDSMREESIRLSSKDKQPL